MLESLHQVIGERLMVFSNTQRLAVKLLKSAKKWRGRQRKASVNASVPTLPDNFKELLKLDLSEVGQGGDTVSVNAQYVINNTAQDKSCVVDSKKADTSGQLATKTAATGTSKLSQGGPMALSQETSLSAKNRATTTKSQTAC